MLCQDEKNAHHFLLSLCNVSKSFPGVKALDNVSLSLSDGETLALIGENGAGKSTLIKILGGIHLPDVGKIYIHGQSVRINNVRDANRLGISIIHQELNLCHNLNISENIFLGRYPTLAGFLPITNKRLLHQRAEQLLSQIGLRLSPKTLVRRLSIGQQQMVEITKALSMNARIIVFDEPTSSLSAKEADRLFEVIGDLRRGGTGVIYVTHRLSEIKHLADRVIVLRDGKQVGHLNKSEIDYERMVRMMVGRDIRQYYPHRRHHLCDQDALKVENLQCSAAGEPVSFTIKKGEIVGFSGIVGAGRTELAKTLFGITPAKAGNIYTHGNKVRIRSPRDAVKAGILMVPEERKTQGLILQMTVPANISMAILPRLWFMGMLNRKAESELAKKQIEQLSIVSAAKNQTVVNLSGGNQQKVVLAKWFAMQAAVLILDEPTRGIDVGAKSEIYGLISEIAAKNVGIMLISSEMEEIVSISDRVIVMRNGCIRGTLSGEDMQREKIMSLAIEDNSR